MWKSIGAAILCAGLVGGGSTFVTADGKIREDSVSVPKLVIKGADEPIPLGEIIIITAELDSKPANLENVTYSWNVIRNNLTVNTRSKARENEILFGAGVIPTKFLVVVEASYLFIDRDTNGAAKSIAQRTSGIQTIEVTTEGVIPPTPPNPPTPIPPVPPVPVPDPVFPTGTFDLSNYSYKEVKNLTANKKAEVAQAIAGKFESISAKIVAGAYKSIPNDDDRSKKILTDLRDLNNQAFSEVVGSNKTEWSSFFTNLMEKLFDLSQSGKLITADQYNEMCLEVALGLRGVK